MKTISILSSALVVAAIAAPTAQANVRDVAKNIAFARAFDLAFDPNVSGDGIETTTDIKLDWCRWSSAHRWVCGYSLTVRSNYRHRFYFRETGVIIDKRGKWHIFPKTEQWPTRTGISDGRNT